jgi:hypothetical protein
LPPKRKRPATVSPPADPAHQLAEVLESLRAFRDNGISVAIHRSVPCGHYYGCTSLRVVEVRARHHDQKCPARFIERAVEAVRQELDQCLSEI